LSRIDYYDLIPPRKRIDGFSQNDDAMRKGRDSTRFQEIVPGRLFIAQNLAASRTSNLPSMKCIFGTAISLTRAEPKKDDDEYVTTHRSKTTKPENRLTHFHLVFVLEPPDLELSQHVDKMFKHVIAKITSALRSEQVRCDYVRQQADLIMKLRDAARLGMLRAHTPIIRL